LFLKILEELTNQCGRAEHDMNVVYKHLSQQKFPPLGHHLNIMTGLRRHRTKSAEYVFHSIGTSLPVCQYPVFKFFTDTVQRRNSTFGRLLGIQDIQENDNIEKRKRIGESWITKRIKRPIDFRFSGAPICSYFKTVEDLIFIYLSILSEKRLVVVSSKLR